MTAIEMYELGIKKANPYLFARVQLILHEIQEFVQRTGMLSMRKVVRLNKQELQETMHYLLVLGFSVSPTLILEDTVTNIHDYELLIYYDFSLINKQFDLLPPIELDCNKE